MEQKNRSIIIGAITVFIVAIILGGVFYFGRTIREQTGTRPEDNALRNLSQLRSVTPSPSVGSQNDGNGNDTVNASNSKIYLSNGLRVTYPKNWGLLTCRNSKNFEFDPVNSSDSTGVLCDVAVKPITVLVSDRAISCTGNEISLGGNKVIKSVNTTSSGDTNYRWCVNLPGKSLDITERVSASGSRATSKADFSTQVEAIISSVQATAGS